MTEKNSRSPITMMKMPSFLDSFLKISDYLGLAYSEKEEATRQTEIKYLNDVVLQGAHFTHFYYNNLNKLLAINNVEKEEFIKNWIEISESETRFLIAQDYYTLASNKRVLWALLVYFYIPNVACFISVYKKEFKIPSFLIRSSFMLPNTNSGKVIYSAERLKKILSRIEKYIRNQNIENTAYINTLAQYLHNFNKTTIPRYKTKQVILDEIKQTKELNRKLGHIDLLFQSTIVSGNIFKDLTSFFGQESYAIELIDYFKKCLVTVDKLVAKDVAIVNVFDRFLAIHLKLYQYEFLLANYEKENQSQSDTTASNITKDIQECRDKCRISLLSIFNIFLRTTTHSDSDTLEEVETEKFSIGMFRCRLPKELEPIDDDHEEIIKLISSLDVIFTSPEKFLNESEINQLLSEFKSHKFHSVYEHLYLYYAGLSKLGRNDFIGAISSLSGALEKCSNVSAGKTQLEVAYTLVILKLLTNKRISYSHLNNELKAIMNVAPIRSVAYINTECLETIVNNIINKNKDKLKKDTKYEKEILWSQLLSKETNLARILTRIKRFNNIGYCRYPGIEPCIYNPLTKVESLISDIYLFLDNPNNLPNSKDEAIKIIVHKLMRARKADYGIDDNLVTLHSFTATDVFDELTFSSIFQFSLTANICAPNIIRLANDPETFALISKAINTPIRSRT